MASIQDRLNAAKKHKGGVGGTELGKWMPPTRNPAPPPVKPTPPSLQSRLDAAKAAGRPTVPPPPKAPVAPRSARVSGYYSPSNTPNFDPATATLPWNRATGIIRGAFGGSGAGALNAGGVAADTAARVVDSFTDGGYDSAQKRIKRYRKFLIDGKTDDGSPLTEEARQHYIDIIKRDMATVERTKPTGTMEERRPVLTGIRDSLYQGADETAAKAQQETARAKEGLGKLGQFGVDVAQAGLQMGLDAATGGLPAMFVRAAGGAAQEARLNGADFYDSLEYGLKSGGLSVATEKIANVAAPFKAVFGKGVLDKAVSGAVAKMNGSKLGKLALSMLSEGGEEFIESVFQPVLQRATWNPNARFNLEEALHDAAVGAVLGGIGSAGEVITAGKKPVKPTTPPVTPQTAPVASPPPVDTPTAPNPVQSVVTPTATVSENTTVPLVTPVTPVTPVTEESSTVVAENATTTPGAASAIDKGKRIAQTDISQDEFNSITNREDVAMDADNRVYKVDPAQHIDSRDPSHIKNPHVNSFQYDHPELHHYYTPAAEELLLEFSAAQKGGQTEYGRGEYDQIYAYRTKRNVTPRIARLLDSGMTYDRIEAALDAIIKDKGADNYADAKRVEMVLDDMLSNGYNDGTRFVPANQAYIEAKTYIPGNKAAEYGHGLDDIDPLPEDTAPQSEANPSMGAADRGFTTPGVEAREDVSNLLGRHPFDAQTRDATGLNRKDYEAIFRYRVQSEAESMQLADDLVYVMKDGKKTFLRDVDEDAYNDLVFMLNEAPAWNAQMVDAANMIHSELMGKTVNGEIDETDLINFLNIMTEHSEETGRGTQAWAKWARTTDGGARTQKDAADALEANGKLSAEQKKELFNKVVKTDIEIDAVQDGDSAALKDIIMRIGRERGVFTGPIFRRRSKIIEKAVSKSLDGLTFDQLKSLAHASSSAIVQDAAKVDWGQRLKTIQMLNMLSNPKTPAKNITGNLSFYGIDALSMDGAALLDMALSKATGTRSVAMQKPDGAGRRAAIKAMQMSAAEIALDVDMGSSNRYDTNAGRTFRASGNMLERVLSILERNNALSLTMPDEFFKGMARSTEAATQRLVDEGKIKTENQNYAKEQADALAKYRTFQDNSLPSAFIQDLHDWLNVVGIGDSGRTVSSRGKNAFKVHAFGLGDLVAPFTKVAGNLVSRGAEYSAFNAARGAAEMAKVVYNAKHGKVDAAAQAKAVSDTTRGLTGTAIAYGFMKLAEIGLLKLADSEDDDDVAALNASEGMHGAQLNADAADRFFKGQGTGWKKGDTLIDVSSLEPLNILMDLGASAAEWDEDTTALEKVRTARDSLLRATAGMPVVGMGGDLLTDIIVYGKDPTEALTESTAKTAVSSLIPNVVKATAKGLDDRPRTTYSGDTLVDMLKDTAKSGVPGMRETLPGTVNALGKEKVYTSSKTQNLLNALINPLGVSEYMQDDVSKELEKVRKATGDASFYPDRSAPRELSYTDKDGRPHIVAMDFPKKQRYLKISGKAISEAIREMQKSEHYRKASPKAKADLLGECKSYGEDIAKMEFLGKDSVGKWVSNVDNAAKSLGVSKADVLWMASAYGSDDFSGDAFDKFVAAHNVGMPLEVWLDRPPKVGNNQDNAKAWLNGLNLTRQQKRRMWSVLNKRWKRNPY